MLALLTAFLSLVVSVGVEILTVQEIELPRLVSDFVHTLFYRFAEFRGHLTYFGLELSMVSPDSGRILLSSSTRLRIRKVVRNT
jgi:hypothetical protein